MTQLRQHAFASAVMIAIGIAALALSGSRTAAGVFFGGALVELAFLAWSTLRSRQTTAQHGAD